MQNKYQNNIEPQDDEINLIELAINLWGQKWIIFACLIVSLLLAVVYVKNIVDVYQVKAVVTALDEAELSELNANSITEFTPESVFRLYFQELKSPITRREYIQSKKLFLEEELGQESLPIIDDRFWASLQSLSVVNTTPEFLKKTVDGKVVKGVDASILQAAISLNTTDSKKSAQLINGFLKFVDDKLAKKIIEEQKYRISNEMLKINSQQEIALEVGRQQRELFILNLKEKQSLEIAKINIKIKSTIDAYFENLELEILKLKESHAIAEQLKIIKPSSMLESNNLEVKLGNQINGKEYLLGTQYLETQINELEKRRNNTKFVEGLTQLNKQLAIAKNNSELENLQKRVDDKPFVQAYLSTLDKVASLDRMNLDIDLPEFYQVTQKAIAPGKAIGRNKNIYLAIGIVLGGMLGLMLALIRIAVANYREKHKEA